MQKAAAERRRLAEEKEGKAKPPSDLDSLAHMRENAEDKQKEMVPEDFENVRLFPILKEAFDIIKMLENRRADADKKIKKIEAAKLGL